MLNKKLQDIRKSKGLTQEQLAASLNVVRQTVSKWEKGLSVPDADMLIKIADIFGISVSELLGANFESKGDFEENKIANELAKINKELAIKNKRANIIWKVIAVVITVIIIFNIVMIMLSATSLSIYETEIEPSTSIEIIK